MRILSVVAILLTCAVARADVTQARRAALMHLPQTTELILSVDVASFRAGGALQSMVDALAAVVPAPVVQTAVKGACGFDPLTVIEGIVIATDDRNAIAFVQLAIDRPRVTTCLQEITKVPVSEKVRNTVLDPLRMFWVEPRVVAIALDSSAALGALLGKKGFAATQLARTFGAEDPTAQVAIGWRPGEYGALRATAKLTGDAITAEGRITLAKGKSAAALVAAVREEVARTHKPGVKKLFDALSINTRREVITITGRRTLRQIVEALTLEEPATRVDSAAKGLGEDVVAYERFANDMCACTTKACVDKVNEEMSRWGQRMKRSEPRPVDAEATRQLTESTNRLINCSARALGTP